MTKLENSQFRLTPDPTSHILKRKLEPRERISELFKVKGLVSGKIHTNLQVSWFVFQHLSL